MSSLKIDSIYNPGSKVGGFVIDTPKDEGLHSREQLWTFQQRHRGTGITKSNSRTLIKIKEKCDSEEITNINNKRDDNENTKVKSNKDINDGPLSPKGKPKGVLTFRQKPNSKVVDSQSNVSSASSTRSGRVSYSSALTIGKTLYNHIRSEYKDEMKAIHSEKMKNKITKSLDKFPELASTLTKLGYMKVAKNVVHYGGGFFGRQADKRYPEVCRSLTSIEDKGPHILKFRCSKIDDENVEHRNLPGKEARELSKRLGNLESIPIVQKTLRQNSCPESLLEPQDESSSENSTDAKPKQCSSRYDDKKSLFLLEHARRKEDRDKRIQILEEQQKNALPPAPIISKHSFVERRIKFENRSKKVTFSEVTCISPVLSAKNTTKRTKVECETQTDGPMEMIESPKPAIKKAFQKSISPPERAVSDMSIDLPSHKYGPTTHSKIVRDEQQAAKVNPIAWRNMRNEDSENDNEWVKRVIETSNLVDDTAYDTFARTKFPKLSSDSHSRHRNNTTL